MPRKKDPFDIVIPSIDVNLWPNDSKKGNSKVKSKLTQTQKTKIKNIAGKCEYPGCSHAPHEVHHIKWLEEGGTDAYSNLIVLCGSHHNDTHGKNPQGKMIPKSKLQSIVRNRPKAKADNIKMVLKGIGKRGGKNRSDSKGPWDIDLGFR